MVSGNGLFFYPESIYKEKLGKITEDLLKLMTIFF